MQFSPHKTHQIEANHLEWDLWMATGRHEFDRHQHLSPHRRLSLGTLSRLVDIASQLGRLAVGLELKSGDARKREAEDSSPWAGNWDKALRRVYGLDDCANQN